MSAHNTYGLKVQFTGLASQQKAAATQQMQSTLDELAGRLLKKYTADLIQQMIAPGPFAPPPPRRPEEVNCERCQGRGRLNPYGQDQSCKPNTRCPECSKTGRCPIPFSEVWSVPNEAEKFQMEQDRLAASLRAFNHTVAGNGTFFQPAQKLSTKKSVLGSIGGALGGIFGGWSK